MTEQLFREVLKEAHKKRQTALFVWANWEVWEDNAFDITPGTPDYDFALLQTDKKEEATVSCEWNGLSMPGLIAVSVEKCLESDKFVKDLITAIERYEGPITLIPKNELSELF